MWVPQRIAGVSGVGHNTAIRNSCGCNKWQLMLTWLLADLHEAGGFLPWQSQTFACCLAKQHRSFLCMETLCQVLCSSLVQSYPGSCTCSSPSQHMGILQWNLNKVRKITKMVVRHQHAAFHHGFSKPAAVVALISHCVPAERRA